MVSVFPSDASRIFPVSDKKYDQSDDTKACKGKRTEKGCYNENPFDKTNWYAFTEYGTYLMEEGDEI